MTEIRHGNRNRRNLYAGPTEQDHFAVTVGPIEHAAAMSAFLADAAKAYIAAGHPMPQPARSRDELIEQVAQLLSKMHVDYCSSGEDEARALAAAGLLADPELQADAERIAQRDHAQAVRATADRDLLLWLHAETKWWLGQYMHDVILWKRQVDEITGFAGQQSNARRDADRERDQLQARIDKALAVLDEPVPVTPYGANAIWKIQNNHALRIMKVREALQGDQPAEPTSPSDEDSGEDVAGVTA